MITVYFPQHKISYMRTVNKNPQWFNQPMRLSSDEKKNPLHVIAEFFECYHLHEIRALLWSWLSEIIVSPNGISNDAQERSNHLFFYEKIEALIEAVLVLLKRTQKRMRKQGIAF
jgi:hypothetical protein